MSSLRGLAACRIFERYRRTDNLEAVLKSIKLGAGWGEWLQECDSEAEWFEARLESGSLKKGLTHSILVLTRSGLSIYSAFSFRIILFCCVAFFSVLVSSSQAGQRHGNCMNLQWHD